MYELTKRNRAGNEPTTTAPFYTTVTIGKARSRGLEWEVSGDVTQRLSLIGSYAYTNTRVLTDPVYEGWNSRTWRATAPACGPAIRSMPPGPPAPASSRKGNAKETSETPSSCPAARGWTRCWTTASARERAASLQFNVDNLFDTKYYAGSHQYAQDWIKLGAPRTARATLRLDY